MLLAKVQYHGQLFREIFSSRCCAVCGRTIHNGIFCEDCRQGFSLQRVSQSQAWAAELLHQGQDIPFLKAPDIIEKVILLFKYDDVVERTLHDIKFAGNLNSLYMLQEELVELLPSNLTDWVKQFDLITTIPTSIDRIRERGYDVPQELFAPLWEAGGSFEPELLQRKRQTAKLFELSPEERRLELEDCFGLGKAGYKVRGKKILLCDDIFTSGATLTEAAKVLLQNGASSVTALAFAAAHENW